MRRLEHTRASAGGRTSSFVNFKPNLTGLEDSSRLEWLISNGLGGYSSSTAINMNTALYHGILVCSDVNLNKKVYLQKLDEEVVTKEESISVATDTIEGDNVLDGWRFLHNFDFNYSSVYFDYSVSGVNINKTITPVQGRNAVLVHYGVHNRLDEIVSLRVTPYMNIRAIDTHGEKTPEEFIPEIYSDSIAGVESSNGYLAFWSDNAGCNKIPREERWGRKILYTKDDIIEHLCSPLYFSIDIEPNDVENYKIMAVGYDSEEKTAAVLKELIKSSGNGLKQTKLVSSGKGASILSLLNSVDSFIIDVNSKKTIVSSYPYSMDKGREAMISLPGFTLINNRIRDAELILEHFLNSADYRGIPSLFRDGKPEYGDVDTSLWLIDRLNKYIKAVGEDKGKGILHTYWWTLKSFMNKYCEREEDGLLRHKGGTWMDSEGIKKEREDAVEVQGLWYNALKIMEKFRELMEDTSGDADYRHITKKFEDNFLERYWTGAFLADSSSDDALRPNQVILLSLDYNVVNKTMTKKILHAVERELLTDYGLRSLTPEDPRFTSKSGNDIKNKFNGNVFPWLLGSFIGACARINIDEGKLQTLLQPIFEEHMKDAGIGTISEMFQGDLPYKPLGSISYSCSVAELLRAHFEHVMHR